MGRTCSVTGGLTVAKSFIMVQHCFSDITLKKQIPVKRFSFFLSFFFFSDSNYTWYVCMAEPPRVIHTDSSLVLKHAGSNSNGFLHWKTFLPNVDCSCPKRHALLFLLLYMAASESWLRLARVRLLAFPEGRDYYTDSYTSEWTHTYQCSGLFCLATLLHRIAINDKIFQICIRPQSFF